MPTISFSTAELAHLAEWHGKMARGYTSTDIDSLNSGLSNLHIAAVWRTVDEHGFGGDSYLIAASDGEAWYDLPHDLWEWLAELPSGSPPVAVKLDTATDCCFLSASENNFLDAFQDGRPSPSFARSILAKLSPVEVLQATDPLDIRQSAESRLAADIRFGLASLADEGLIAPYTEQQEATLVNDLIHDAGERIESAAIASNTSNDATFLDAELLAQLAHTAPQWLIHSGSAADPHIPVADQSTPVQAVPQPLPAAPGL
jgi:hypothetical protein